MKVKSESEVAQSATPWTAAFQAPPSMGFSRQEYWSRVPLPSPAMQETPVQFLGQEDARDRLPTPVFLGFPCVSAGKESTCNVEDLGSISGLGRPPGEGKGYPLQDSGLENS